MRAIRSASAAAVTPDTVLLFEQTGSVVYARYRGGPIVDGHLLGKTAGQHLRFRYVQIDAAGHLDAGVSDGLLETLLDGRYRLTESFQWTTRRKSGTNVFEEV